MVQRSREVRSREKNTEEAGSAGLHAFFYCTDVSNNTMRNFLRRITFRGFGSLSIARPSLHNLKFVGRYKKR